MAMCKMGFPGASVVKDPPTNARDTGLTLGHEDPLEEEMVTYSSILAWKIPWTEEPGGIQPIGSQRVRRLSACARACTHTHTHTHTHV